MIDLKISGQAENGNAKNTKTRLTANIETYTIGATQRRSSDIFRNKECRQKNYL